MGTVSKCRFNGCHCASLLFCSASQSSAAAGGAASSSSSSAVEQGSGDGPLGARQSVVENGDVKTNGADVSANLGGGGSAMETESKRAEVEIEKVRVFLERSCQSPLRDVHVHVASQF